jgi:DNA transformation protein
MLNFRLKWNQMAVSESTTQFVKEQLSEFADVEMKKMFGGVGIFLNGIMFALITAKGQFMMRVGESNIQDFKAKGSQPFNHEKKGRAMPYWEVPVEVAENRDVLKVWAAKAYDVATAAKKKK